MKVRELIAELAKQDPEADVVAAVGWAADTAVSDREDKLEVQGAVRFGEHVVVVRGWLSNCGTELVIKYEEDPG